MKKNKMLRIATALLVAVILTTCVISGTFAKYTSEKTVEASARVASWNFTVNDKNIAKETFQFDLFKTVNDEDGSAENEVAKTEESIIAPGTSGKFALKLKNASEVAAEYTVEFTVTKSDETLPIQFSVDGNTWTNDLADVTATSLAMNAEAEITVQWKWAFEGNDTTDTALGSEGTASVTVSAKVTATQVN